MDVKDVLGNNDIDDVRWLCYLTDSELDLLIGLKNLVKMRADKIGQEALARKFDLRMLRTFIMGKSVYCFCAAKVILWTVIGYWEHCIRLMSFIFMEHLKEQLQDVPLASSNLFKQNLSGSFARMTVEDLYLLLSEEENY